MEMLATDSMVPISGYAFGTDADTRSPLSLDQLDLLKKTVMLDKEDEQYLRMAGRLLADHTEEIVDLWYKFVGSQEHLQRYFAGPDGKPNTQCPVAVSEWFGRWIQDACNHPYDQDWLNYQHEIGLRCHRSRNDKTNEMDTVGIVPYRYLMALLCPIVEIIKPFLTRRGHYPGTVERMHQAFFKSVLLHIMLWGYAYVKEGDF